MEIPGAEIDGCARSHERLRVAIARLADPDIGRPSMLPGWTIGHVLTHLARNAEAMCLRVDAATRAEVVEQYVGGVAGRAAEIDAGSSRPAREIESDVVRWSTKLDDLFGSLSAEDWARPVRTVAGGDHPVSMLPFRRWREVEVHLVDLGIGLTPLDWPPDLVERTLPRLLAGLPDRADQRILMAWLLGRGDAPALEPWG
ncbi:MAG: maleylpyruvate isomerase family mycothiol-dependent enzyme [Actinobacteria bacterium]|nr:maleylpyruvate isomerase family mycothiol-dependent enzyme [Actinomycetota bacterium]